jgi:hypothetical protein
MKSAPFSTHHPCVLVLVNLDVTTHLQCRFKSLQHQKCTSCHAPWLVPFDLLDVVEPTATGIGRQDRQNIRTPNGLLFRGRAESDPEMPDARTGILHARIDQFHFEACVAICQRQKFHPIADCTDRADKVTANTQADGGCKIRLYSVASGLKGT